MKLETFEEEVWGQMLAPHKELEAEGIVRAHGCVMRNYVKIAEYGELLMGVAFTSPDGRIVIHVSGQVSETERLDEFKATWTPGVNGGAASLYAHFSLTANGESVSYNWSTHAQANSNALLQAEAHQHFKRLLMM